MALRVHVSVPTHQSLQSHTMATTTADRRTDASNEAHDAYPTHGIADEVGLAGAVEGGAGAVAGVVVGRLGDPVSVSASLRVIQGAS